jgi:hypothetical protein
MVINVFPPTPEIEKAIFLIEQIPERLVIEAFKLNGLGQYHSDVATQNYLRLIIRNVEGLLHLCRQDLLLLPAALNIARPILEMGCNALWLMIPEAAYDRENRLFALLNNEFKDRNKYINNIGEFNVDEFEKERIEADRMKVKEYRDEKVKKSIPTDWFKEIEKPNFQELLKELNLGHLYPTYRILCASTHGSHAITWLYKREVGDTFGECIEPKDWHTPLFICWWTLAQVGAQFLTTFGGNSELFLPKDLREEIKSSVEAIKFS